MGVVGVHRGEEVVVARAREHVLDAGPHRGAEAAVDLVDDERRAGMPGTRARRLGRAVLRAVVHDDDLASVGIARRAFVSAVLMSVEQRREVLRLVVAPGSEQPAACAASPRHRRDAGPGRAASDGEGAAGSGAGRRGPGVRRRAGASSGGSPGPDRLAREPRRDARRRAAVAEERARAAHRRAVGGVVEEAARLAPRCVRGVRADEEARARPRSARGARSRRAARARACRARAPPPGCRPSRSARTPRDRAATRARRSRPGRQVHVRAPRGARAPGP